MSLTVDQNTILRFMRDRLEGYAAVQFPEFKPARHQRLLASKLEDVEQGRIKRLCVLMPPRHGKSRMSSELFPAWYLGRDPRRRILLLTYGDDLSSTFGRTVRNYLRSPVFSSLFPECQLSGDSNAVRRFATTNGGSFNAVGVGGPITGKGADLLILDDTIKGREEADSQTYRESLIDWYRSVARTRLQPGGSIVLVQTRWGTNDFVAWLLSETSHEGWEVISLPAIACENDPLGRQPGEALWPESYPVAELEKTRATLGSRDFNSLYQQEPLTDADVIFNASWLQFYEGNPPKCQHYYQSWDLSFGGTSTTSSWVVGQVWGTIGKQKYLIYMVREQTGFSGALDLIRSSYQRYPTARILIENKANGPGAIETLKRELGNRVIAVDPAGGKQDRAYAVVSQFERCEVWLPNPEQHPWVMPLLREYDSFPRSNTDDCIDSMTQALRWIDRHSRQRQLPPSGVSYFSW